MKGRGDQPGVGARIIQGLTEFAEAVDRGERVAERFTCRTVRLDFRPARHGAASVKRVRRLLGASQAVFAQLLGVSVRTVHAWEQGVNTPSEMAGRFLDEIRRDPDYWRRRLREAVIVR